MKKWLTIILIVLLIFSYGAPVFAMAGGNETEISVNARVEHNVAGEYSSKLEAGGATLTVDGDITIIVTAAPKGAVQLIVTPIPTSETEAWSWISSCFKGKGTPIHVFDIHFIDKNGNRINANGSVVNVDCPHCSSKPMVCSLTTDGVVNELGNPARSVSVTFTTDGSHYYVLAAKVSSPVVDDDHKVEVKETAGGKVDTSDKTPGTGDTVTIIPKPDNGKVVDKITVTDKKGNPIEVRDNGDGSYSYEQPDDDVTVDVTFEDNTTGDGTVEDNTTGDGTVKDNTTGDGTVEDNTTGDGTVEDNTTGDGTVEDNTTGDGTVEDNTTGDGTIEDTATGVDGNQQSGDNSQLGLWSTVAVASAAGIGGLGFFLFKRRKPKK